MRTLPLGARAYILGAALTLVGCAALATRPGAGTPWVTLVPLALLYAATRVGPPAEWGGPVLLAAAMLLPPPAAALVAVGGGLLGRVERRPAAVRRIWRAAHLALASAAAAYAFGLTGGPAALARTDLPYALAPATAAAVVFCLVRVGLEGGVLVAAERHAPRAAWCGALPRSLGPHLVHGLAGLTMAVLWRSAYGPAAALLVLFPMGVSASVFVLYHRERTAHQATIRALVQAVDIKDGYTRGHSERVGRASVMIARELGMTGDRLEVLRIAGILHDVGKLGVPTRLLRKEGPLTPDERRVIELHPEYGHEMVRGIGFLEEARAAILHHHERLDGSGYPYGLAGRDIPECARVVAVADAFDAMTSNRSYSRARPVAKAVEELHRCAGTQFDPRMVRALARALDRHGWHVAVTADAPLGGEAAAYGPDAPSYAGDRGPGQRAACAPGTARTAGASVPRGNVPPHRPPHPADVPDRRLGAPPSGGRG
ncbi:HD-GYP domain-containing protein [Streptomyces sp. SAJ15]|uniref:HD-GYP domain-containing protein n=1 Tax=Streptomyces sp. SAJ15 TaxID=2011095 RepID=UPI00118658A0|nr:HD-GYP domain-containing protein [Streptomyces sp. SAJ15]TVL94048.1 metal-dependent phosphohydrolase [Streptomyces sp. SAJ15]